MKKAIKKVDINELKNKLQRKINAIINNIESINKICHSRDQNNQEKE